MNDGNDAARSPKSDAWACERYQRCSLELRDIKKSFRRHYERNEFQKNTLYSHCGDALHRAFAHRCCGGQLCGSSWTSQYAEGSSWNWRRALWTRKRTWLRPVRCWNGWQPVRISWRGFTNQEHQPPGWNNFRLHSEIRNDRCVWLQYRSRHQRRFRTC